MYVYVDITFSNIGQNMWMIHLKQKNKEGRQQIIMIVLFIYAYHTYTCETRGR